MIVVTTSSSSAFRYFTGKTMWSWICHAQCAPFLAASSLWSAILRRIPDKIVPVASYGESQVQGLVFQKNGRKFTHTYRTVREICQREKIENFIFHDLRHCAVTNLADAGVETETIMKIVGHSSVEMFLRYRTIKPEKLDDAMSRLNTLITRRSPASSQALEIATI